MGNEGGASHGSGRGGRACLTRISHRKPKIRIAEGGQLVEVRVEEIKTGLQLGSNRKEIIDFSADSRRRLQRKLATINEFETSLPDFGTLTYPGEYSGDWKRWKRDLDVWNKATVRKWPDIWGLWRMEFQKRGAPHFHFLWWDGPKMEGMDVWYDQYQRVVTIAVPGCMSPHNEAVYAWMSETWYRIVGSGDPKHLAAGTRVEPIQSWNGVRSYASKYLAKLPSGKFVPPEYDGTGRFWGVIGRERWKSTFLEKELTPQVFFAIKRVLRKRLESKGLNPWRMRSKNRGDYGMSTFLSSITAIHLLAWALEEKGDCPF